MIINPASEEAYKLFHYGALALARCEQHGMRVDERYVQEQQKLLKEKINSLEHEFAKTDFYKQWKAYNKGNLNIYSDKQLSEFIYKKLGHKVEKTTEKGNASVDIEALQDLNIPDLQPYLKIGKFRTLKNTFIKGLERETVDGVMHPFFHLHIPVTYRGCIAKGTKVLVMRKFKGNGIPIEKVRKGDYVYCFDDELKPAIREVEWAGKTGHKRIIRLHWVSKGAHKNGYLDCTPEHKIRLIDGTYVEAQNLMQDFRKNGESHKLAKVRTLSCHRNADMLNFTGHLKNGNGIYEHRLIYKTFNGKLKDGEIVHHKDGDHFNHKPKNLKKETKSTHAKLHSKDTINSPKSRINNANVVKQGWKDGKYINAVKSGFDNGNSLRLTKYQCLRLLFELGGKITKVKEYVDFNTFKNYLKLYDIDPKKVSILFDVTGTYISATRFKYLYNKYNGNQRKIRAIIGHNFYKYKELLSYYDSGNHIITKIEWLKTKVDVYDLTVKDYNNFFANEICVHNSSSDPNFQNMPKRDEEQMNIIRGAILPSKRYQLMELDYSQLEVRIAAAYHKDPTMLTYINDKSTDMHRDMAQQIFKIKKYNPEDKTYSYLRNATKNGFVFPAFYGDYHVGFAKSLSSFKWLGLPKNEKWKETDGCKFKDATIAKHLIKHGIDHLGLPIPREGERYGTATGFTKHLQEIENHFWHKRFPVYNKWKEEWYQQYLEDGYFYNKTGFTFQGVMNKKDCINYPVQSSAFHVLLWSLIQANEEMIAKKWKTRIIGQIHDAIVFDLYPPEKEMVIETMKRIMTYEVRKHWSWINVPLEVECELCPIDAPWSKKEKYNIH